MKKIALLIALVCIGFYLSFHQQIERDLAERKAAAVRAKFCRSVAENSEVIFVVRNRLHELEGQGQTQEVLELHKQYLWSEKAIAEAQKAC